jgi:hypothetical protein
MVQMIEMIFSFSRINPEYTLQERGKEEVPFFFQFNIDKDRNAERSFGCPSTVGTTILIALHSHSQLCGNHQHHHIVHCFHLVTSETEESF